MCQSMSRIFPVQSILTGVIPETACHFRHVKSFRKTIGLSVIQGFDTRQFVNVCFDEISNLAEDSTTFGARYVESPSGVKSFMGGIHGGVDVRRRCFVEGREEFGRGGIIDAVMSGVSKGGLPRECDGRGHVLNHLAATPCNPFAVDEAPERKLRRSFPGPGELVAEGIDRFGRHSSELFERRDTVLRVLTREIQSG